MLDLTNLKSFFCLTRLCLSILTLTACGTLQNKQPPSLASAGAPSSTPMVLPATGTPSAEPPANSGSLWRDASHSLMQDIKAWRVGDIVTITVSEKAQASKQSTTQTAKDKDFSGDMQFNGFTYGGTTLLEAAQTGYSTKFSNNFKGTGSASRSDTMTTYMTATVVEVLPNGNLVIRGSRWTKVNDEMQQIILEGMVRPNDINRNNQILSQNIADAKIFFVGKGPVTAQQKPGWLGQLYDYISPF